MKRRYKILVGAFACLVLPALFFAAYAGLKRHQVDRTRRQLRAEGFATELSQLGTNHGPEALARAETVMKVSAPVIWSMNTDIRTPVFEAVSSFTMHTSNSVVVAWKEEFYAGAKKRSPWPAVHQTLEKNRVQREAAVAALLAGPVAFAKSEYPSDQPEKNAVDMGQLPTIARTLGVSVLCNLYYGERAQAWTNLLAMTRLVTRSEMLARDERPARIALAPILYCVTWQALQGGGWSDQQLAALDAEWARFDYLERLPGALAYFRVSVSSDFQELRRPKNEDDEGLTLKDLVKEPKIIPHLIKEKGWLAWYRWAQSYDDERHALLYLRDREVDLRRAIQARTVIEMQKLPSVINPPSLASKHFPTYPACVSVDSAFFETRQSGRTYNGTLALAADAEIRRRIMLTAIALERYRLRNGVYPKDLDALTNAGPKSLIDFVDGQPLRYRRTDDGHFLLYSISLDGVDNHGDGGSANKWARFLRAGGGVPANVDLIWPLPARLPAPAIANAAD